MEKHEAATSFEARAQKQKKKKRARTLIVSLAVIAVLAVGSVALVKYIEASAETAAGTTTYNVNAVTEGEVTTSVSGSGTLSAVESEAVTAQYASTVEEVFMSAGDAVNEGDVVARLSSDALDEAIDAKLTELDRASQSLANADETASASYIKAGVGGTLAAVYGEAGDTVESVMAEHGCLALVSADGRMTARIEAPLAVYDEVTLDIAGERLAGSVISADGEGAVISVETTAYPDGAAATVYGADGELIGETELSTSAPVRVTGTTGVIAAVYTEAGDAVSSSTKLYKIAAGAYTSRYVELSAQRDALIDELSELRALYYVTAPFDGLLSDMTLSAGDELAAGEELASFTGGGYTVALSVDELDIAKMALGQTAVLTLDALDGEYEAAVTAISYSGSASSYVTSYPVTLTAGDIEGALPGMSASADITILSSGTTLMAPVSAVQTEDGESFVYVAPDGASLGMSYAEAELDLSTLKRVSVTTGMSDGSYIAVTGELSAGDLIIVPQLTTSSEYSDDGEASSFGGFGGMGGFSGGGFSGGGFSRDDMPSGGDRQQPSGGAPSQP